MKFEEWRILYRPSNYQRDWSAYSTNGKVKNSLVWVHRLEMSEHKFSEIKS